MKSCTAIFGPDVVVVGDPVDVVTGANLDRQLDFTLAGPLPLPWFRWYTSARNWEPGGHGWGHTHEYERRLVFDLDGVRYLAPSGEVVLFPPLERDGDSAAAGGYTLGRATPRRYFLSRHGEPMALFDVADGRTFARLAAIATSRAAVRFRYAADGLLHTITDSTGRPVRVEHDAAGRVARLTVPAPGGRVRQLAAYEYDAAGNLVVATDPYNNSLRFQSDRENRQVRRTDRRGYSFEFEYDDVGRCVRAGGQDRADEVRLDYAPELSTTLVTRADGGQWLYQYDATGVVTKVIDPAGGVTQRVAGAELDPAGVPTRRLYDPAGGLLGTLDPFGRIRLPGDERPPGCYRVPPTTAERVLGDLFPWRSVMLPAPGDPALSAAGAAAPHLHTLPPDAPPRPQPERDEFGRLFRETFPDGSSRRWVYDPNGNVAKYTDRDGGTTTYEYASWNARVGEALPGGRRVGYEFAATGVATAVTDPGGARSEYRYDHLERLIEIRRHGAVRETYEYDPAGRLVCKRNGAGRELARWEVGPLGLPSSCAFPTGDVHTYGYDPRGRFVLATGGGVSVTFAYLREFRAADLRDGLGVEHRFGPDGVEATTLFGTYTTLYRWLGPDEYEVTDPTGGKHRVRYLGGGVVERAPANGHREVDQYDADGRCLARVAAGAAGVRARVFRYSGEGCLTAVEDSARGTTRYQYDAANRLAGIERPDGTREPIDLDAAGNLLRMPGLDGVSLRDGNRLLTANGERFGYDDRNHLAAREGRDGVTRYHYDANDMLVRVESPGKPDWTAGYDPFCRRVWKQWGSRRVEFWWDTDRIAAERDETGRLRVYVYADDFALVPLLFVDYAPGEKDQAAGQVYTVHADQIGTPIEVRDGAGAVAWEAEVAPYGLAAVRARGVELNLRFPGHYHDAETGLHYNRFRYYDPALGRYLQSDPIGVGGGLNLYAYPDRPLDRVDVRGLSGDTLNPAQRAAYNETRGKTPSEDRKADCNKPGSKCALTGMTSAEHNDETGKNLSADHIVPLKSIAQMPGFTDLSPEQQAAVANNPKNFQPLSASANSSKGAKEMDDWKTMRGEDLDEKKRAAMLAKAATAEKELQAHIDKMLKDGKEAEPRKCSRCGVGTA